MPVDRARRLIVAAEEAAQLGFFTKAITLFKTAARLDPRHTGAQLHLAELYRALEMEREASSAAREALRRAVACGDRPAGAAALAFLVALSRSGHPQ
jgi:tetratricopeptide (TPR) repeat protein